MKLTPHEFEQLRKEWDKKLQESGFIDIEKDRDGEKVLRKFPEGRNHNCYKDWEIKQEYFLTINHIINNPNTNFRDDIDRYILSWHCEGLSNKRIVDRLLEMGICKHRNTIRNRIWKYQFQWKLRKHPPKYSRKIKQLIP